VDMVMSSVHITGEITTPILSSVGLESHIQVEHLQIHITFRNFTGKEILW